MEQENSFEEFEKVPSHKNYYTKALICVASFGVIKSTLIRFLPFSDIIKGTLVFVIFIIFLMLMFSKSAPNLKIVLKKFITFVFVVFVVSSIMKFLYSFPNYNFINAITHEARKIIVLLIIGLLIALLRLSKKHFFKLSSTVLALFIGVSILVALNIEKVQKLINDAQKKEQVKTEKVLSQ